MIYLTEEELVKNIAEQTERAFAVIEHTDFANSSDFNPNMVIIPFLSNIADSALIVMALERNSDNKNDCHRNALRLVINSDDVKKSTKDFIHQIQEFRRKYTSDGNDITFDSGECLDFLNAYDCFMFDFIKNSKTVRTLENLRFSSFRNFVKKLLKNSVSDKCNTEENELVTLIRRNNSLMEELIAESKKNNQILNNIMNFLINGGKVQ